MIVGWLGDSLKVKVKATPEKGRYFIERPSGDREALKPWVPDTNAVYNVL